MPYNASIYTLHMCKLHAILCVCIYLHHRYVYIHVLDGYVTNLKYTYMLCVLYMYILMGIYGYKFINSSF